MYCNVPLTIAVLLVANTAIAVWIPAPTQEVLGRLSATNPLKLPAVATVEILPHNVVMRVASVADAAVPLVSCPA